MDSSVSFLGFALFNLKCFEGNRIFPFSSEDRTSLSVLRFCVGVLYSGSVSGQKLTKAPFESYHFRSRINLGMII